MARQLIVLALIFAAIVGLASAADSPNAAPTGSPLAEAPKAAKTATPPAVADAPEVEGPTTSEAEGPAEASPPQPDVAVAGPVGEESNPADAPAGASDDSAASALQVSAVAATVAVAGYFF